MKKKRESSDQTLSKVLYTSHTLWVGFREVELQTTDPLIRDQAGYRGLAG